MTSDTTASTELSLAGQAHKAGAGDDVDLPYSVWKRRVATMQPA